LVGSYDGQPAFTSSDSVDVVPGPVTASTSGFDPSSKGQTKAIAGQTATLIIQGRDSSQNKITYAQNFDITITSSLGRKVFTSSPI
jgi:hypothetical protein